MDGELFLESIRAENRVRVTLRDGSACVAGFRDPGKSAGLMPRIGPVTCTAERTAAK